MRGKELLDKMELVDFAYVEAADSVHKKKKGSWWKWGAAAACVSVVFLTGFLVLRMNDIGYVSKGVRSVSFGGITRVYKDVQVTENLLAIEWPWEYKTVVEQFNTLILKGMEYNSTGMAVDAILLGEKVDQSEVVGYDTYSEKEYRMPAEVRSINGISKEKMVAVQLGDAFYSFKNREYMPPTNFGEVLDEYSLAENLKLDRFTVYDGYEDKGYYCLTDDQYIWDILSDCREAVFVKDDNWNRSEREYLNFTATSDALGVYKRVFYVTADGYIWTNIFEWAYIFEIGEETTEQIITYATENSEKTEWESYTHSLAGTLVEITEEYILVDDSILCADNSAGMVFKVPTDDIRVRRCVELQNISVGSTVAVNFTGEIDVEAGNVVEGAYSVSECMINCTLE